MNDYNINKIDSFCNFIEDIDYNMFYIVKCNHGKVSFTINQKKYKIKGGNNFIIKEPALIEINSESSDVELIVYSLSYKYYDELVILFDDQFFKVLYYYTPNMLSNSQMAISSSFLDQIYYIYSEDNYIYKKVMISNIIQCYLLDTFQHIQPLVTDKIINNTNHRKSIMNKFFNYITEYKVRDVEFYARKMNLSSRNLYNITQASINGTPKEMIDYAMIAIIKNMLLVSNQNNQQIAEKLNFPDQSAFGQYFKRCEGISPSMYRKNNKV